MRKSESFTSKCMKLKKPDQRKIRSLKKKQVKYMGKRKRCKFIELKTMLEIILV